MIPIYPAGQSGRPVPVAADRAPSDAAGATGTADGAGAASHARQPGEVRDNAYDTQPWLKPGPIRLASLPPLALYVHFPWCVRKCPYCDFNSHQVDAAGGFPEAAYLAALRRDLELALPMIWGRKIVSVFIGGGTPSLISCQGLDQLLSDLRSLLNLDGNVEITMEANPGTFEAEKFKSFRQSGINRLSIGIQSFNDAHLKALGRIHDANQARAAAGQARLYFDNLNLDLMYALPQQTLEQAQADLQTALDLAPDHLSLYHLTLEPNTVFAKYPPALPDDDASALMQETLHEQAQAAGYARYEVSAWSKPGRRARHNLNYWEFGDYLGIGAGAHSKISFPQRIVRQMRYKQPKSYLEQIANGNPVAEQTELAKEDLGFEFMLNGLRLVDGFAPSLLPERTGLQIVAIEAALRQAEQKGLLYRDHQVIRPSALGLQFLNDLQQMFLPD